MQTAFGLAREDGGGLDRCLGQREGGVSGLTKNYARAYLSEDPERSEDPTMKVMLLQGRRVTDP
jgi:hypothetical protein